MTVNISIKNVPEEVLARLKQRAARNHRSLQGELMALVEQAARVEAAITVSALRETARALGPDQPSESADIVRAMRDGR